MKKFFGSILLILLVLIAGLYAGRDVLIKNAVVSGGSMLMQTSVTLDGVTFDPLAGVFHLQGLAIANPEGYSAGNALYLGEVKVKMDPWSLTTPAIMVEEVRITQPEINFIGSLGSTNISKLQDNIAPKETAQKADTATSTTAEKGEGKRVEIRYFVLDDGKVSATFKGLPTAAAVKLPMIEMHDLGKKSDLNLRKTISMILMEVAKTAQRVALSGSGVSGQLENLKTDIQQKTKGLTESLGEKFKGLGF